MRVGSANEIWVVRGDRRLVLVARIRLANQPFFLRRNGGMGTPDRVCNSRYRVAHLLAQKANSTNLMNPKRKRIFLGLLCGITAIIALLWPALPMVDGPDRLAAMPLDGPDFHSEPLGLTTADKEFLAGADAVQRIVRPRRGAPIMLSVIDGSGNRHAVHDPSYCLAGGGWHIRSQKQMAMSSGMANWISMEKDGATMEALWFFDDGREQFTSPLHYWWRASLRRATRGLSGPEPLLVMLRVPPGEPADWQRVRQVLLPSLGFR